MLRGYRVIETDLNAWPDQPDRIRTGIDFLDRAGPHFARDTKSEITVIMNPPFSRAVEFVERSFELGARKVLMFQRLAFLESQDRRDFWEVSPPARIWMCGDRATCWRGDMPEKTFTDEDGTVVKGRDSSSPTAHAWFVWEVGHGGGMRLGHIYKDGVNPL